MISLPVPVVEREPSWIAALEQYGLAGRRRRRLLAPQLLETAAYYYAADRDRGKSRGEGHRGDAPVSFP